MLPCASRETSWLAGSTSVGKAAVSDKKAVSKSDWFEIQAYSSLGALLKCKLQCCKRIGDFSTHSSRLLNETLKGKAGQMPPLLDMLGPLGKSQGLSPHKVLPSGMLYWRMHLGRCAKASHLFQHTTRV